jgi:hypothetical protein
VVQHSLRCAIRSPRGVSAGGCARRAKDDTALGLAECWQTCFDLYRWLVMVFYFNSGGSTDQSNGREDIDVEQLSPLFSLDIGDSLDRVKNAVVDDDAVQTLPLGLGEVCCLLSEREIREVSSEYLDLSRVLLAQLFHGFAASGNRHDAT